jgi:predicted aconitase with swiveling domain
MSGRVFAGRRLVGGTASGEALVCTRPISGWGGIDPGSGRIVETGHPQRGESLAGRVLVIPGAKGSSGWSGQFHLAKLLGTAPAAIVTASVNSKLALGLTVLGVPALTDLPAELWSSVRTGDRVELDDERLTLWRRQDDAGHDDEEGHDEHLA